MLSINSNTWLLAGAQQPKKPFKPQLRLKSLSQDVFTKSTPPTFTGKAKKPNEKTIEYYNTNTTGYFESTKGLDSMKDLCDRFLQHLPKGATFVDAGCGSGRDSKYFIEKGCKVVAFDDSAKLAGLASKFLGQPVLNETFESFKSEQPVDGIWACASLLHLPKADLDKSIENLTSNLKPGGYFFTCLKDGQGESEDRKGRFFSYYSEKELKQVLTKHKNLKLVEMWKTGDNMNRNDTVWISAILRKV